MKTKMLKKLISISIHWNVCTQKFKIVIEIRNRFFNGVGCLTFFFVNEMIWRRLYSDVLDVL